VKTAEDSCGGGGTVHADGSSIDTGRKLFGFPALIAYPVVALLLVGFLLTGVAAALRRMGRANRRRKRRALGIT
jgi:hypothetical protein